MLGRRWVPDASPELRLDIAANGDCELKRCCCVHSATQCERCKLQGAQYTVGEELECRKSVQEAVQEVLVRRAGGGGGICPLSYPSQVQDWRPGARLIGENWESARTTSGDIVASGKKAQGPRRADH